MSVDLFPQLKLRGFYRESRQSASGIDSEAVRLLVKNKELRIGAPVADWLLIVGFIHMLEGVGFRLATAVSSHQTSYPFESFC